MAFNDKIKKLRLSRGLTQADVAKGIILPRNKKISPSAIGMYEQGRRKPSFEVLEAFADFFNVDLNTLSDSFTSANQQNINLNPSNKSVRIPVLGYVVAGVPISAVQDILGYEEISKDLSLTGEFFALRIKGDSMEPTFTEGDIIIVRQQPDVESNEIAVVLVNGDDGTVKRIKKDDHGIVLIGDNALAFSPKFYSNDEIASLPIKIVGKVVELRRSF